MERNTKTTIYHLTIGDRFYKCNDKSKTVFEKVEIPQTESQLTYKHWCIEAKYFSRVMTSALIEKLAKSIRYDTEVIFLRHKDAV